MFGPLPRLHTLLFVLVAVGVGVGIGTWIGLLDQVPLVVSTGIAVGIGLAALASFLLLHDFQHQHVHASRPRRDR